MSAENPSISLVHEPSKRRYEIHDGDAVIGFTQYVPIEDTHLDFVHTEVSEEYGGQGLAAQLVAFALADVRAQGKRIVPECPYVASWLRKHGDAEGLTAITDWPS